MSNRIQNQSIEKVVRENEMELLFNMETSELAKIVIDPTSFFKPSTGTGSEKIESSWDAFGLLVTFLNPQELANLEAIIQRLNHSVFQEIKEEAHLLSKSISNKDKAIINDLKSTSGEILESAEKDLKSLSKKEPTKDGFFKKLFSKNDDWTRHELAVLLKCLQHILLADGKVDQDEMELMKIEMRKAEVLGNIKNEEELANFFDISKNISNQEIEVCLSNLSDVKKQTFKDSLSNMAQVDGDFAYHESQLLNMFNDYMK